MKFGAAFPPNSKSFEVVEQGKGLLHDAVRPSGIIEIKLAARKPGRNKGYQLLVRGATFGPAQQFKLHFY